MRKATGNHLINVFPSKSPSNKNKKLAVATWNVRSLAMPGKLENLEKEKKRLNLDIIGISETNMIGNDERETEENYLFYSGPDANHPKRNGVGFLISKHLKGHVNCIIPKSDRVIFMQLKTKKGNINFIQVYAPTAEKDDEEVEKFYEEIKVLLKNASKEDCLVVLGDFNAKVGNEEVNNVAGKYGLCQRNMRGSKLIDFCIEFGRRNCV
ncbi:craniofacial development protein 2-like [Condylostylus longicornis]|uniref:craniofacial development protein 2-like n=1 Tax=Condylostylus longicornis TaxID=2530218 RepID=UPI00244DC434|nr:craniofacial development protein 2-like [Condylostylus longicornis]